MGVHGDMKLTDSKGKMIYLARGKMVSITDKVEVASSQGEKIATIVKKPVSIHDRHTVTLKDGTKFDVTNQWMHVVRDVFAIEELGWKIKGDILGLSFDIYDKEKRMVAHMGIRALSLHDKYTLDIYQPDQEEKVVGVLFAFLHMMADREKNKK